MIVYSKSSGLNPAATGRLETPIKMIIERENERLGSTPSAFNTLFNVETSNRFGETIVNESEFNNFSIVPEGDAAVVDTVSQTGSKFIEHLQFMKEFIITAEMMEDAEYGIASSAKRRAENFIRSYYNTLNYLCSKMLAFGTASTMNILGGTIDMTVADGLPVFSANHTFGSKEIGMGTQSNYYYGDVLATGGEEDRVYNISLLEDSLSKLASKLRNMKDEIGNPLGYTADTIILPGNRPTMEAMVRKVCGSYSVVGSSDNDINIHYGKWKIVVLPYWTAYSDDFIVMSSEANKSLCGNILFNRVPLTVTNWVDHHTGNYIWNGRCRIGAGFGSYKHMIFASDSGVELEGSTNIAD